MNEQTELDGWITGDQLWKDTFRIIGERREERANCTLSKEDVIDRIKNILRDASLDPSRPAKKYFHYKQLLASEVGWDARNPHFREDKDFEAVMSRLVVIIDWDDSYGRTGQHETSELWLATASI